MAPALLMVFLATSVWQGGRHCPSVLCGNVNISFPFGFVPEEHAVTDCGGGTEFQVRCRNDTPYLGYYQTEQYMQILSIFYDNASLLIAEAQEHNDSTHLDLGCHIPGANTTTSKFGRLFSISPLNQHLIFYNCSKPQSPARGLTETKCHNNTYVRVATERSDEFTSYFLEGCNAAIKPVLGRSVKMDAGNYEDLMRDGFLVTWHWSPSADAVNEGGYHEPELEAEYCEQEPEIPNHEQELPEDFEDGGSQQRDGKIIRIALIAAAAAASLLFPCIYVMVCHPKGQRLRLLLGKKTISSTERNIEALIVSYGSLAPKRYNYSEVIKITSSLNNKLGEGGYGVVYKGRLHDGRLVAVKFLHDCKGNGEEFVNEVMSIGRTSHVNIVSLFGFCLERSRRALIYEYMPNGSLDQYIYSDNPKELIGWQNLYMIAVGIARGLEYLHHSCNTRIVHFDIKPQNILLDQGFCPKIADFGLAKLCHTKESKLSMTGTRGTIGFIAPEVHSRAFGVVSTKSDVYSYGMMLLEMVGGRKNVKSVVEKSSQKYFPDWIYDHFAHEDGLEACEVTCEVEEIARKMILIGLWCVQVLPTCRPTISKVMEMFDRGLDELDIPPKQNFSQMPEDLVYTYNTESTSFSSHTKTQAFSAVVKTKKISGVNSKNLKRLPTL